MPLNATRLRHALRTSEDMLSAIRWWMKTYILNTFCLLAVPLEHGT